MSESLSTAIDTTIQNGHGKPYDKDHSQQIPPDPLRFRFIDSRPNIIYQANSPSGQEIGEQLNEAVIWLFQNMEYIEGSLPIPEEFSHIAEITPFVYKQETAALQEFHWYSGFRISLKEYSGSVLVFNGHSGLTAKTINKLYKESMLPLSNDLRIIFPDS